MASARKIGITSSAADPFVTGTNFSAVLAVRSALWYPNAIAGPLQHDLASSQGNSAIPSWPATAMKILSGILWSLLPW
jgi:hypothetical protein